MKTEREQRDIDIERGAAWRVVSEQPRRIETIPGDFLALHVANIYDPHEWILAELTPAEARQLAAELVALADEIEQE